MKAALAGLAMAVVALGVARPQRLESESGLTVAVVRAAVLPAVVLRGPPAYCAGRAPGDPRGGG